MRKGGNPRCGSDHRGSTLLLFPAGLLVVMILGAICVDFSKVHLVRRELHGALSAMADDAAAMMDRDALRSGQLGRVDLERARRLVARTWASHPPHLDGRLIGAVQVSAGPRPGTIRVAATVEVDHLFARAMPDAVASTTFTVTAIGELLPP